MDTTTKIRTCRDCDGSGEQVNLTVPGGVEDCRQCRGQGSRRVPVTRELVDA